MSVMSNMEGENWDTSRQVLQNLEQFQERTRRDQINIIQGNLGNVELLHKWQDLKHNRVQIEAIKLLTVEKWSEQGEFLESSGKGNQEEEIKN